MTPQKMPAIAGGLEDHIWSIRELIEESARFRELPSKRKCPGDKLGRCSFPQNWRSPMPMFFGSRNGLKPCCDFTSDEAEQLIDGEVAEEVGEPTEYLDEVLREVDERLLDESDGQEYAMIFQWDFETTGHLWLYTVSDARKK